MTDSILRRKPALWEYWHENLRVTFAVGDAVTTMWTLVFTLVSATVAGLAAVGVSVAIRFLDTASEVALVAIACFLIVQLLVFTPWRMWLHKERVERLEDLLDDIAMRRLEAVALMSEIPPEGQNTDAWLCEWKNRVGQWRLKTNRLVAELSRPEARIYDLLGSYKPVGIKGINDEHQQQLELLNQKQHRLESLVLRYSRMAVSL